MARNGDVMARSVRRGTHLLILSGILLGIVVVAGAQDQVYPTKKPVATKIFPDLFVLDNRVVEEQWRASLSLINAPSDLKQIELGQCVRFGVIASGDEKDRLLQSAKMRFEFSLTGASHTFAAELPETVKQVKPEGGDFVTEALAAGGVKNPMLSTASIAASKAKWCMPVDTESGTATIQATVETSDGKSFSLNPRKIEVTTFDSSRKNVPFKDMSTFGPWLQHYHSEPDPAELLPGLRIVASDDKARLMPNIMVFFVQALKISPAAANDLLRALPNEDRPVRTSSQP